MIQLLTDTSFHILDSHRHMLKSNIDVTKPYEGKTLSAYGALRVSYLATQATTTTTTTTTISPSGLWPILEITPGWAEEESLAIAGARFLYRPDVLLATRPTMF